MCLFIGLLATVIVGASPYWLAGLAVPVTRRPNAEVGLEVLSSKGGDDDEGEIHRRVPGGCPCRWAFSADGKTLLVGDTSGEVMARTVADDELRRRWKVKAGSHAVVAFSVDQTKVYVTTEHGVRVLDAARARMRPSSRQRTGNRPPSLCSRTRPSLRSSSGRRSSSATLADTSSLVVHGKPAETIGTIETSTVAKGAEPRPESAVPLAVELKGPLGDHDRPALRDGQVAAGKDRNVLWAYVCGDDEEGSPGNPLWCDAATVVSAAWAKEGGTAATGDTDARVIVWDVKTMEEARRVELGGRIMALAGPTMASIWLLSFGASKEAMSTCGKRRSRRRR